MVVRAYKDLSSLELLVGDSSGVVSRWCTARMDQLSADEAAALAFEHTAYSLAAVVAQASEQAVRNTSQLTFRSSEREREREMEREMERGSEAEVE